MAVSLQKGQRVNLSKDFGAPLKKVLAGLGWDTNRYDGNADFDLDLVMFACNSSGRCISDKYFIFYGNLADPEGAVTHTGDNRTGEGDGDDEAAIIDFTKMNPSVDKIVIGVTIYEGKARNQNFGSVDNAFIRLVDEETGEEKLRYDLGEDFSTQTAVIFAEIYKQGADWKFKAVGQGYDKDLADFCREYGLEVA